MAMVLTCQKPTQRDLEGEVPEGLPGSTKSAVCVERSVENLGDPRGSWGGFTHRVPLRSLCRVSFVDGQTLENAASHLQRRCATI